MRTFRNECYGHKSQFENSRPMNDTIDVTKLPIVYIRTHTRDTNIQFTSVMAVKGTLRIGIDQLNLSKTLSTGQNFRWKKRPNDEKWIGILDNCHVITLRQKSKMIEFELLNDENVDKSINSTYIETRLRNYFRLDHDIDNLYSKWASQDDNFAKIAPKFKGIRLLRQDVLENIFSFICSSNNNISRISRMIESLCTKYGEKLYSFKDNSFPDIHQFPPIDVLANVNVDSELRLLSFGYVIFDFGFYNLNN